MQKTKMKTLKISSTTRMTKTITMRNTQKQLPKKRKNGKAILIMQNTEKLKNIEEKNEKPTDDFVIKRIVGHKKNHISTVVGRHRPT